MIDERGDDAAEALLYAAGRSSAHFSTSAAAVPLLDDYRLAMDALRRIRLAVEYAMAHAADAGTDAGRRWRLFVWPIAP